MHTSELAAAAGVPVSTLRFYERRGLIEEPERSSAGYRRYATSTAARLRFIGRAKALGFTLADIGGFLELADLGRPPEVPGLVAARIDDLDRRIADLQRVRTALAGIAEQPPAPGACPVIDALGAPRDGTGDVPSTADDGTDAERAPSARGGGPNPATGGWTSG
ncbi:MerR family transcriptional regulator [Agromyces kandeliae]|uniref:MerR family DNA-binding transcriptional regulator n=1 Tax=Agromyces kandeliae TaxID=2666141 RepID=A0A6L5R6A1_9MICO|nr:MerR family transcriptional regulator [Agromyces kandeliae]MRX45509.1 MerR family DNA-binding transcriptional regulator [Agromyces kandeliae]